MRRLVLAAAAILALGNFSFAADKVKVDITQIVAHPALDAVRKGVEDVLAQQGYKNGENLVLNFQSAQGNISTATQIARQFVGDKPDVIVTISTPSAQTMLAATKNIPIVFAAVSDPVEAKLVPDMKNPGGNVTGICDRSPVEEHIKLLKEIRPDLKKLGYLYNAAEANSVSTLNVLKKLAEEDGIEVIPSAAPKSSDVQAATRALIGKVDMIYVPTDNTIISVLEGATKVAAESKTPLFTADPSSIGRGAFAAQGIDYYDSGLEAGKLVGRILKGEKPADIAVVIPDGKNVAIDLQAAEKMGVVIPQPVLDRAAKIINK
ncbi:MULTISPECIES: ABC transporter substrate-binding protein [Bartonella]|uniref:ABC transporter substrate-binding protein n=1 Tax=Bartonella TaxID=773 RepID=UPI0018DD8E59|nr:MULTISPECIES: ABC transporter substrate-binding protein [Bartonella]MBH9974895.1 ABC transporter substrate-binding protein [Bartonella choladocola]MBI0014501.1 ABC transporter substrate-binding protein [Bartonella sp. B10834G3]MBI0139471.1 ABC transporter substrate-binding protein [Bartonella choladocola]